MPGELHCNDSAIAYNSLAFKKNRITFQQKIKLNPTKSSYVCVSSQLSWSILGNMGLKMTTTFLQNYDLLHASWAAVTDSVSVLSPWQLHFDTLFSSLQEKIPDLVFNIIKKKSL